MFIKYGHSCHTRLLRMKIKHNNLASYTVMQIRCLNIRQQAEAHIDNHNTVVSRLLQLKGAPSRILEDGHPHETSRYIWQTFLRMLKEWGSHNTRQDNGTELLTASLSLLPNWSGCRAFLLFCEMVEFQAASWGSACSHGLKLSRLLQCPGASCVYRKIRTSSRQTFLREETQ